MAISSSEKTQRTQKTSALKTGTGLSVTLNDLPASAREKSVRLLSQTLANLSDLHSQSKQAHWNVRGAMFFSQHELFDKLADEFFEPIDDVAERILALGGVASGTVRQSAAASELPEFPSNLGEGALVYVTTLAERVAIVARQVRAAVDASAGAGDTGTSDLLTGISRSLDKALWFLEAHTRK